MIRPRAAAGPTSSERQAHRPPPGTATRCISDLRTILGMPKAAAGGGSVEGVVRASSYLDVVGATGRGWDARTADGSLFDGPAATLRAQPVEDFADFHRDTFCERPNSPTLAASDRRITNNRRPPAFGGALLLGVVIAGGCSTPPIRRSVATESPSVNRWW